MLLQLISDFLHQLATVLWIGGICFLSFILNPALLAIEPPSRAKLMGAIMKKFSILAWACIIILIITGFFIAPEGAVYGYDTSWGIAFSIKHMLVLIMIIFGVVLSFILAPKMRKLSPAPGEKPSEGFMNTVKQVSIFSKINLILGILVLLLIAIGKWIK